MPRDWKRSKSTDRFYAVVRALEADVPCEVQAGGLILVSSPANMSEDLGCKAEPIARSLTGAFPLPTSGSFSDLLEAIDASIGSGKPIRHD